MTNIGRSIFAGVLIVIALVGWLVYRTYKPATLTDINNDGIIDERDDLKNDKNDDGVVDDKDDDTASGLVQIHEDVRLETPRSGATVTTPLIVKGEAKTWYFEGSFPVKLISPSGKVLVQHYAQAQGEWMTADYVPFIATLEFISTEEGMGKLVLMKDNPSGLPANNESVEIPVRFTKTETMSVRAYFSMYGGEDCNIVQSVTRIAPKSTAVAEAAIKELLKGPTSTEASLYATSIPAGTVLQKIEIKNGTAYVDFNSALDAGVAGSCLVTGIRTQIEQTLKQFSTIKNVVISINGKSEDILQP